MSFEDLEAGVVRPAPLPLAQVVAHGVFQINTKVVALRHLGDALGTPKDTPALRVRLRSTRAEAAWLARITSYNLKQAAAAGDGGTDGSTSPCSKLAMDFEAALSELQKVQQRIVAAERQVTSCAAAATSAGGTFAGHEQCTGQTQQQLQQQLLSHGTEVEELEAVVDERERGIRETEQVITEINEIFRDLYALVDEQACSVDHVVCDIETAAATTGQAEEEVSALAVEADRVSSSSSSSSTKYLLMFVVGIFLFIFLLVLVG
ncbi:hypothetical protein CFC21_096818 [Triticum aestivum]|uniref:t-SNARE coiled-coil homology domain-containing protein n=2 Tax=Triticum aestivum TaxID=4565 RepID=A0A3B6RBK4_WHEAT|nr:hypothetical protein CFC21_096818 [Triticum aestivum]